MLIRDEIQQSMFKYDIGSFVCLAWQTSVCSPHTRRLQHDIPTGQCNKSTNELKHERILIIITDNQWGKSRWGINTLYPLQTHFQWTYKDGRSNSRHILSMASSLWGQTNNHHHNNTYNNNGQWQIPTTTTSCSNNSNTNGPPQRPITSDNNTNDLINLEWVPIWLCEALSEQQAQRRLSVWNGAAVIVHVHNNMWNGGAVVRNNDGWFLSLSWLTELTIIQSQNDYVLDHHPFPCQPCCSIPYNTTRCWSINSEERQQARGRRSPTHYIALAP